MTGKLAYVFPGQGSQFVGMGRELYDNSPAARAVFERADSVLKFQLSRLCFEGPEEHLRLTVNAQPALVTVSLACLATMKEAIGSQLPEPDYAAGHSLGEYTALAVAGVFDDTAAVFLSRERGRLMYEAGLKMPGAMAAVLGLDENILLELCRQTDTVIANFNCPGQLVISGATDNVARASELAKAKGATHVIPLPVSGAFHTPLMKPAVEGMARAISGFDFRDPTIPVIANVTAQPLTTAAQVKTELLDQLCNGVQWQRSIAYMVKNGITTFVEVGAGRVLSGLIKRIERSATTISIGDTAGIKEWASQLTS